MIIDIDRRTSYFSHLLHQSYHAHYPLLAIIAKHHHRHHHYCLRRFTHTCHDHLGQHDHIINFDHLDHNDHHGETDDTQAASPTS